MDGRPDIEAAPWSGLIVGAVFMMLDVVLVDMIGGGSPWAPPRIIAAMGMGDSILPPPAPFNSGVMDDGDGPPQMAEMMIGRAASEVSNLISDDPEQT